MVTIPLKNREEYDVCIKHNIHTFQDLKDAYIRTRDPNLANIFARALAAIC